MRDNALLSPGGGKMQCQLQRCKCKGENVWIYQLWSWRKSAQLKSHYSIQLHNNLVLANPVLRNGNNPALKPLRRCWWCWHQPRWPSSWGWGRRLRHGWPNGVRCLPGGQRHIRLLARVDSLLMNIVPNLRVDSIDIGMLEELRGHGNISVLSSKVERRVTLAS